MPRTPKGLNNTDSEGEEAVPRKLKLDLAIHVSYAKIFIVIVGLLVAFSTYSNYQELLKIDQADKNEWR